MIESYLFAVRMAEEANRTGSPELRAQLERRTLGEQMIRLALFWGQGTADAPELTPVGRAIAQAAWAWR